MAEVVLFVYDISGGMARMMSMAFTGKQIDGIWHTSVVVYGKEYYFGGGICSDLPLRTPYGTPVDKIKMGVTGKSLNDFSKFLQSISNRFTMESYDLIKHNCNNFTDECMRFLVNQKIPEHITGLPGEFLATPLGQQLAPMISSMSSIKDQFFAAGSATADPYADYASHEIYFTDYKKIDSYPAYDLFAKDSGVIVFWDPKNDESVTLGELVAGFQYPVAFCDTLRTFYLAPDHTPCFRLFLKGEIINDYGLQEFKDGIEDIKEILHS
jgi:PPPDE putative peptidase domain